MPGTSFSLHEARLCYTYEGMHTNDNQELEDFKRRVDLVQVATSYGYRVDRKASCKTSVVMVNEESGSKIVVATAQDGHGIFFEVHGDAKGSAIDFVMYREGCSLGGARKVLREWLGQPRLKLERQYEKPRPARGDRALLAKAWHSMKPYAGDYLTGRGLSDETIREFSEHIRMDDRGNVCFRHDDEDGLTGWELKNRGFTGFSGGGKKALFMCNICPPGQEPERIVITEAAIDAMSYAQLSGKPALFVSFSGALSAAQQSQLADLLHSYPQATVITATDADAQGENYAVMISAIRPDAFRARPSVKSRPGATFKDWNDVLMDRPAPPKRQEATPDVPQHADIAQEPLPTPSPHPGRPAHAQER
jgi:hypothetical protein